MNPSSYSGAREIRTHGPYGKLAFYLALVLVGYGAIVSWIFSLGHLNLWRVLLIYAIVVIPRGLMWIVQLGRTIVLDANGATIRSLFFKKTIPWAQFQTARLIDFGKTTPPLGLRLSRNTEGVLFQMQSVGPYPIKMTPALFMALGNRFLIRGFFVQFAPDAVPSRYAAVEDVKTKRSRVDFPVDRAEFLSCMDAWGVRVEGLNAPRPEGQTVFRY